MNNDATRDTINLPVLEMTDSELTAEIRRVRHAQDCGAAMEQIINGWRRTDVRERAVFFEIEFRERQKRQGAK